MGKGRKKQQAGEIEQRADVLRRYTAKSLPNAEDDARFAAELGISVDSLIRLATAWRRHGTHAAVRRDRAPVTADMRRNALEALTAVDLAKVPASRRAETSRRLSIIQRFLALDQPSRADRVSAAAEMGLSVTRFSILLRSWILHRTVADIPGATIARRPPRKRPERRDAINRFVDQARQELGHDGSVRRIHARASELAALAGVKPFSVNTTYLRLLSLRAKGEAEVLEDHPASALNDRRECDREAD